MKRASYILIMLLCCTSVISGQTIAIDGSEADTEYKKEYNKNIKMTKLNGVYIPGTLQEAFKRIDKLSPPESLSKFKAAPEAAVCKKLHFGIGRWMIEKWNFYGGSRISHHLKQKGILHPDDMAQFLLRTYHRNLNDLPLDEEALIKELAEERKKIAAEVRGY